MIEKLTQETSAEKETGRVEAFSDGVFAIAITLLVLELKVPHMEEPVSSEKLLSALASQWTSYFPFLFSFTTILIMWVNHHNLFKIIARSNNLFMFANGFLLLMVTLVPFPTGVVAEYLTTPAAPAATALYSGFFVIINLAYITVWWAAAFRSNLLKPGLYAVNLQKFSVKLLMGVAGYLAATVVAWWSPLFSIAICALLWVFWAFNKIEAKVLDNDLATAPEPD